MRRRDTIIIAVLVNAALLLVLFATAMRSDSKKSKNEATEIAKSENPTAEATPSAALDSSEDVVMEILGGEEMELPSLDGLIDLAEMTPAEVGKQEPSEIATTSAPKELSSAPKALAEPRPAEVASQSPARSGLVEVVVKKGDALEKIARAHRSTVSAIMQANNLSSTQLKIGQVLKVPEGSTTALKTEERGATSSTPKEDFYTVKEGDNPWLIANRLGIKLEELLRINNLDDKKAKKLRPGDKLKVR